MKIIYILPNILPSFNESGGASVIASRLVSFLKLDIQVQIINVRDYDQENKFSNIIFNTLHTEFDFLSEGEFSKFQNMLVNTIDFTLQTISREKGKIGSFLFSIQEPIRYIYPVVNEITISSLQKIVESYSSDFIIAEHLIPALLVKNMKLNAPIIYSHHDWIYVLQFKKLKQSGFSLKRFYNTLLLRFIEKQLVKDVDGVFCVSAYEASQIQKKGVSVLYLPTLYPNKKTEIENEVYRETQLVHFGGMAATANRLGLENFIDKCWDKIKSEHSEMNLILIGSLNHISNKFKLKLIDDRIKSYGFVAALSDVLLPMDINIIPWDKPTGGRTRIPLVFRHKQVLLSTYNAVLGAPEVKHLKNAYLVNTIEEFPEAIKILKHNRPLMKELSENGYAAFENYFSIDADQSGLKSYLEFLLKK